MRCPFFSSSALTLAGHSSPGRIVPMVDRDPSRHRPGRAIIIKLTSTRLAQPRESSLEGGLLAAWLRNSRFH